MKGVVTLRNPDLSFDGVGMNNKTITADLKTLQGIRRQAYNFAIQRGRLGLKIEFYPAGRMYSLPTMVEEWERENDKAAWTQKRKLVRK